MHANNIRSQRAKVCIPDFPLDVVALICFHSAHTNIP
uniref:Uncharacterized protein n=1 Tax=Arundo donax TaxID=35708 RepID=A0A0A9HZU3_ARUDO